MKTDLLADSHPVEQLTPYRPGFWIWDQGQIAFAQGATLTFRDELVAMVERLQPLGAPPMEAMLLFLAATRGPWAAGQKGGNSPREAWENSLGEYDPEALDRALPKGWRNRVDQELHKIGRLGKPWRSEMRRKSFLAEVCFENCGDRSTPDAAARLVDLLKQGFVAPTPLPEEGALPAARRLARGLRPFLQGLPDLNEKRLERRWLTGIESQVSPLHEVQEAPPASQQVRDLLKRLLGDPEWSGVARLARDLMAAVHVPRSLGDPEELQLGGFSDLSNRGTLDRLLVSELAQDDLVLAARLALNEALYLRRESPPKAPKAHRYLLIDNGIRLWGTPRLFAMAVCLAMTARQEKACQTMAFVPTRHQQLQSVDLCREEGVTAALGSLQPHAHPGNALLEMVKRAESVESGTCELIVVSHHDVLADPAFRSVMGLVDRRFYLATVERSGKYVLHRVERGRTTVLGRALCDLRVLLDGKESDRLRRSEMPEHFPSIFHRRPFPIRLPLGSGRERTVFTREDGIYKHSRDGRVLHFDREDRGGRQLYEGLPSGRPVPVVEVQALAEKRCLLAFGSGQRLTFLIIQPDSGECRRLELGVPRMPMQVMLIHQHAVLVFPQKLTLHRLADRHQVGELSLPTKINRCYGDLVFAGSEWMKVGIDGRKPCLQEAAQADVLASSEMEEFTPLQFRGLRKHFRGIAWVGDRLVLLPKRLGAARAIVYEPSMNAIVWRELDLSEDPDGVIPWTDISGPGKSRIRYQEAVWPDGSRAIMDGRGLLHLESPSCELEDLTLILVESAKLSAWVGSQGGMGDAYFFDEPPALGALEIAKYLQAFRDQMRKEGA